MVGLRADIEDQTEQMSDHGLADRPWFRRRPYNASSRSFNMTGQPLSPDHARIGDTIRALYGAIGAKHADKALDHYAPEGVYCLLAPPLRSAKPDPAALNAWFAPWTEPIGLETGDLEIVTGGDLALGTGLSHMTGTKTDDEKVDLWFRVTFGLRQVDGHWKVFHEHESVPFYMDGSHRAAVDLRP
jgi:PhnB protein